MPFFVKAVFVIAVSLLILPGCAAVSGGLDEYSFPEKDSPGRFISESFLKEHLNVLAHDSLLGRGTGQPGSRLTAEYLETFYTSGDFSVIDGFTVERQSFSLEGVFWDSVSYNLHNGHQGEASIVTETTLRTGELSSFVPLLGGTSEIKAPIVFAGYGSNGSPDISGTEDLTDLENAWIMTFDSSQKMYENHSNGRNVEIGKVTRTEWVRRLFREYGAAGVILISDKDTDEWEQMAGRLSHQLERPLGISKGGGGFRSTSSSTGNVVSVHPEMAMTLLGFTRTQQLDSLRQSWGEPDFTGEPIVTGYYLENKPHINRREFQEDNIIAIIPGVDEDLKNEHVILSAHYDHMGLGEPDDRNDIVYNGADDNASGTSVLMQVADAFRQAADNGYHPSRTIVFLHAAAEEWGLIGARYYASNPLLPLNDIVANVNVDMVGHVDNEYAGREDTSYVYYLGAGLISSGLQNHVERANESSVNLYLDDNYNRTNHHLRLYRRSDHWAFGEKNIPFVFFFSGLHDNYHVPSDTADRISWALLTQRAKLVTELTWRLAETRDRPVTDQRRFMGNSPEISR